MNAERKDDGLLEEFRAAAQEPLNSMTLERREELERLEQNNQPLDIDEEELREYREFNKTMEASRRLWSNIDSMADRLKTVKPSLHLDELKMAPISTPAHRSEVHLEELVQESREARTQDAKNTEYLSIMAAALQEIRAAREDADLQQKSQDRFNKKMTWAAILIAAGSITTSIVMPIIEHLVWPT